MPSGGVCPLLVDDLHRIHNISFVLGHLDALLIQYVAHNDDIFKWASVKDGCGDGKEGIEPSSGLVHRFRNKLCREVFIKHFLIFKWIVPLCKRHGSGVKPCVDHLVGSLHVSSALFAGQMNCIDVGLVKLNILWYVLAFFLQFFDGTDTLFMTALTFPDWQWCSPVSVSGDTPVNDVFQELTHSTGSYVIRIPVDAVG